MSRVHPRYAVAVAVTARQQQSHPMLPASRHPPGGMTLDSVSLYLAWQPGPTWPYGPGKRGRRQLGGTMRGR
jgi:hypothetical protein